MSSSRELQILQGLRARLARTQEISEREDAILADIAHRLVLPRPPFFRALGKDALTYAYHRGEMDLVNSKLRRWLYVLRLPFLASEFFALELYRLRVVLRAWHVPLLPTLINWGCAICWDLRIADPVIVDEGVYIPHGQLDIEGLTYIGKRCYLSPFVGIGLIQGDLRGPHLEDGVFVGTGVKMTGPLRIGRDAKIGANAVVLSDVPAWATAVGVPARIIARPDAAASKGSEDAIIRVGDAL